MFESDILIDALNRTDGSVAAAAVELNTTARGLRYKMEKIHIDFRKFRQRR